MRLQWGYNLGTTATNDTFTFPVAFSTACYTVITSVKWDTNDGYSARPITALTKTNFTMYVKRSDFYICWISVGKQQWGYFNNNDQLSSAGNTRTYPLSLSTVYAINAIRLYSLRTDRHGLISLKSFTTSSAVFQGSVWDSGGGTSNNTTGTFFWFVVGE